MRLSILVPVYNVAPYLPELLEVLLPQLTDKVEVIFYDDLSSDGSANLIRQAQWHEPDASIRLLTGSKNIGITRVRAQLLQASMADYIWFIDSDDRIDKNAINRIFEVLNHCEPDVLLFNYEVFFDGSNQIKQRECLHIVPPNTLLMNSAQQLYRSAILDGKHYFWNKIFRHSLLDYRMLEFDIPAYEDIAYTPILLSQCRSYYYLSETLLSYRIRKDSMVQKLNIQQAYGVRAYIEQARYAHEVMHDEKSRAYLLYKACIYYFRLMKKISQSSLTVKDKTDLQTLLIQLYARKLLSEWQIVFLLLKSGMAGKALKLIIKRLSLKNNIKPS